MAKLEPGTEGAGLEGAVTTLLSQSQLQEALIHDPVEAGWLISVSIAEEAQRGEGTSLGPHSWGGPNMELRPVL